MTIKTYTSAEAAEILNCNGATVRRACADHGIAKKHGSAWVITAGDLKKLKKHIKTSPGNPTFGKPKGKK